MAKNYRPNACVVLFNDYGKVLLCKRQHGEAQHNWQFPQGGIESGETPTQAACRELMEETSVVSAKLIYFLPEPFYYDFPPQIYARFVRERGFSYDGQKQFWCLFHFCGDDAEINLQTKEPEFVDWRWADIHEAIELVWPIKKEIYLNAIERLAPEIDAYVKRQRKNGD